MDNVYITPFLKK